MPKTTFSQQNADSLERIAGEIEEMGQQLRLAAAHMRTHNIESIEVGGLTSLTRGMDLMEVFLNALRRAQKKLRAERGDFVAGDTVALSGDTPSEIKGHSETKPANGGHQTTAKPRRNQKDSK